MAVIQCRFQDQRAEPVAVPIRSGEHYFHGPSRFPSLAFHFLHAPMIQNLLSTPLVLPSLKRQTRALFFLSQIFFSSVLVAAPKPLFESKLISEKTPGHGVSIDVDIKGSKKLVLVVSDGGDSFGGDWADWAEPRLVMADSTEVRLTEIEWKSAQAGWGKVRVNSNAGSNPLRAAGASIPYGIGTHAPSVIEYILPEGAVRFVARGVLDEGGSTQPLDSSVTFSVYNENPGIVAASPKADASRDPAQAVDSFDVHPELDVQLFASEPMLLSPSSIDVDARGRVWVCEVVNYRGHAGERSEGDRILILQDTDGDAKADKSTVFYQGKDIDSAHGICVLGNKALVSAGEDVFWLIDETGDDKADRKELVFTKVGGAQHDHGIHAAHFGPDGRLYFNFGNASHQLCDAKGQLITDIHGVKCTSRSNLPYQEGMVFRCEPDGTKVELLAWNFRNNWEVAVDSFGTMWQSDNDDDGNKSVRINYVMEFGDFGYKDASTGAGWQSPRIGLEQDITQRHWHQNDPGVVPNMLITGSGSPTGIQVYEGDLLPAVFHGQPIHCDAGPNVVRGYITSPQGAGYKAEMLNVMQGVRDRWFRPSDVCVAPDGSLIVADWYDPGVGGHGMGDTARGRLFRVTKKGASQYRQPELHLQSLDGAIAGLKSPNEDARYQAWTALVKMGAAAEPALKTLATDTSAKAHHRARALWLLGSLKSPALLDALGEALADDNASLNAGAIRIARQQHGAEALKFLSGVKKPYRGRPVIVREQSIALRFATDPASDKHWADMAANADPADRWMIEALGIGADLSWESRLAALGDVMGKSTDSPLWSELLIRSRKAQTPALLAERAPKSSPGSQTRLLRALQLLRAKHPSTVATAALSVFMTAEPETALSVIALMDRASLSNNPEAKARLDALLKPVIGKPQFVSLVERLNLIGFENELLSFIQSHPNAPEAITAAKLIAANRDGTAALLAQSEPKNARALAEVLGRVSDRASVAVLNKAFPQITDVGTLGTVVNALALSSEGGKLLLRWHGEKKLSADLQGIAAVALSRSTDAKLRDVAARELPVPAALGAENFPSLAELVKLQSDASQGPALFAQAGCVACHQVKGQYINFGPDLSQIGAKLSKEGLFTAILYPSAAIEHSFNGLNVTTKQGQSFIGYLISETDDEITLRLNGGAQQSVERSDVTQQTEMTQSLMPPGLAAGIGPQGLANLVAWLQGLK